jgi:hypothetical protein
MEQVQTTPVPIPTPVIMEAEALPESMVYYLKQLCGINGIDYNALEKSKYYGIEDKKEVNKIFFAGYTKPKDITIAPAQRKALTELFAKRGDVGGRLKSSMESRRQYYADAQSNLNARLAEYVQAKKTYELSQSLDTATLIPPVEKLLSEGRVEIESISAVDGKVRFKTVSPTVINYVDKKKNIDMSIDMGTFIISVDLGRQQVFILKDKGNTESNGHYHPHVNNGGGVCWGNAQGTIETALMATDIYTIVNTCLLLLSEYNDASPYQSLAQFELAQTWERINKVWIYKRDAVKLGISHTIAVIDTWYRDDDERTEFKGWLYMNKKTKAYAVQLYNGEFKEIGDTETFLDHPSERDEEE